jgi:hypothetical protein
VEVFIGSLGEFAVTRPARPLKGTTIREANGIPAKAISISVQLGTTLQVDNAQTGFCVASRHEVVQFLPLLSKTLHQQKASDIQKATL